HRDPRTAALARRPVLARSHHDLERGDRLSPGSPLSPTGTHDRVSPYALKVPSPRLHHEDPRGVASVTLGRLLVDLLPITILSAFTPWTIVGVIVLLASKRGVTNAVAFTLGWFTAILALGAVIVLGVVKGSAEHSRSVTWFQIGMQL